ncbi:MAG: hypothetical protein COV52_00395 [Gammaproteobacteria bacterium CG11_big_fil_rev_8_21_14_0_20_46_22]|nr:MAG: hypothetical protein COV52_00395 [Gammaproteobacteria bacterium CG11_big_fil_rev_8_21_14_0_20_46_22]
MIKFCPLVDWRRKDTWSFIKKHQIPHSPLFEQGYTSIGCKPCTQINPTPNNERAGRWIATSKTECGLHYPIKKKL